MSVQDDPLGFRRVKVQNSEESEPAAGSETADSPSLSEGREYWGVPFSEDLSKTWLDVVREFREYKAETKQKCLGFRNEKGDLRFGRYVHRFIPRYTKKQYAKMKAFERGVKEDYSDPSLAFLTFTASTTDDAGNPRAPKEHLEELVEAWRLVRYELRRSMDASRKKDDYPSLEFEFLRILEPTTDKGNVMGGYAHQHVVVVADGDLSRERLHSVIDKHVEKCPSALPEAHDYDDEEDEGPIEIKDGAEMENLGAYLFKYMGKSYRESDREGYEEMFDAVLWETGKRRFQPSDGAQKWMKYEGEDTEEDWTPLGVFKIDEVDRFIESDCETLEEFRELREREKREVLQTEGEFNKWRVVLSDRSPSSLVDRGCTCGACSGSGKGPPGG